MRLLLILCTLLLGVVTRAQDAPTLQGKWEVDFDKTALAMSPHAKERFANMKTEKKENVKRAFQGRTFQFAPRAALKVKFTANNKVNEVNGQWNYEARERTLTIFANGVVSTYEVEWISANQIRLISKNPSPQGVFQSLFLSRLN